MLEFKILEEFKPNPKIIELIKNFTYKTKKGKIKVLLHTNLQVIEPTEYLITHPMTLTILEYKVNEISNKPFYIKEHKAKYNLKEIEKTIEKLKMQEKRLVDLYLSSTLDVETINHKNEVIKKEIDKLNKKKTTLDPDNSSKEYTIELVKKLDCIEENDNLIFTNIKNICFAFLYDLLTRKAKRDLIHRLISQIEISRDKNYNIDIKNIKFTDELITKSSKEYIKYLNKIMENNNIGIKFYKEINKEKLKNIELDYDILSIKKMKSNKYSNEFLEYFISKSREHLYVDGIISCPYVEENKLKDILILVPKKDIAVTN